MAQAPLQRHSFGVPNTPKRLEIFQRYHQPLYFVTFNTHRRQLFLANDSLHKAFIQFARGAELRGVSVGRYVIMPDHVHMFVRGNIDFVLSQWVRQLKRALSKSISAKSPHWQAGFFDHVIRYSESYSQKWDYVRQNPVRAKLVQDTDEWRWQGEIIDLEAD